MTLSVVSVLSWLLLSALNSPNMLIWRNRSRRAALPSAPRCHGKGEWSWALGSRRGLTLLWPSAVYVAHRPGCLLSLSCPHKAHSRLQTFPGTLRETQTAAEVTSLERSSAQLRHSGHCNQTFSTRHKVEGHFCYLLLLKLFSFSSNPW